MITGTFFLALKTINSLHIYPLRSANLC